MEKVAIYSSVRSVSDGGGVASILSFAQALARKYYVDIYFPKEFDSDQLFSYYGKLDQFLSFQSYPEIAGSAFQRALKHHSLDNQYRLVLIQTTHIPRLVVHANAYLLCDFPFDHPKHLLDWIKIFTFRRMITNSGYTAYWIKKFWKRKSIVLYPPVKMIATGQKLPIILSVGRFTGGGRPKRQIEMIQIFRELCEKGLKGWELHLAGFVQDEVYALEAQQMAGDLPVVFHFNVTRDDLEVLYAKSTIYWHAVGLGEDVQDFPSRVEHFGITTVEAMSAGCIPVVINLGGVPEVVGGAENGFLWNTALECVQVTWDLINNEGLQRTMSHNAATRATFFNFQAFCTKLDKAISK